MLAFTYHFSKTALMIIPILKDLTVNIKKQHKYTHTKRNPNKHIHTFSNPSSSVRLTCLLLLTQQQKRLRVYITIASNHNLKMLGNVKKYSMEV
jgi:hypothetical protein